MYNESELAREAKALIKRHLKLNDGAAQGHVDVLSDGDLADIVAANDYPLADRPQVIQCVLTRATPPLNLVTPPDPEPSADAAQSDAPAVTPEEASPPAEADEPIVEEADDLDGTVVVD